MIRLLGERFTIRAIRLGEYIGGVLPMPYCTYDGREVTEKVRI